jgi:O-antigen ligase
MVYPQLVSMGRDLVLPGIVFGLTFWSIGQFDSGIEIYRDRLATAMMVVANLLLVPYWVMGNRSYVLPMRLALFWLAFFTLGFLSAASADNTVLAFDQLRLYFSVFLLGLGFRCWFSGFTVRMAVGLLLALCMAHVVMLVLILGYATGIIAEPLGSRLSVPYHGNIRHVAHHGMVAACAGLAIFFIGGRFRMAGYLLGAASTFGLVFLGQRGGLLGFLVFIVISGYFLPKSRYRIAITGLSTLLISFGLVYLLALNGITNKYSGSMVERVEKGVGASVVTNSSGRLTMWKSSVEVALKRPVLGHGPDGFRFSEIERPHAGVYQPHNSVVQLLVELGITGLVLVSLFLYQELRRFHVRLTGQRETSPVDTTAALLFGLLIGFLIFSLFDGLFYHSVPLLMFSVLSPLAFAASMSAMQGNPGN